MVFLSSLKIESQTPVSYVDKYNPMAQELMKDHNIPASVILAISMLESGNGTSKLSQNKHNYFGIPLGQSDLVFNNSFYLFFLYFGIFTPLLLLIFIFFIFYKFKKNSFKYLLAFFSLIFLSGSFFTLEYALILYFLNYSFHTTSNNELAIP